MKETKNTTMRNALSALLAGVMTLGATTTAVSAEGVETMSEDQIIEAYTTVEEALAQFNKAKEAYEKAYADMVESNAEKNQIRSELMEAKEAHDQAKDELAHAEQNVVTQEDVDKAEAKVAQLQSVVNTKRDELETAETNLQEATERMNASKAALETATQQLASARKAYDETKGKHDNLMEEVAQTEKEAEKAETQAQNVQKDLQKVEDTVDDLKTDMDSTAEKAEKAESEAADKKADLDEVLADYDQKAEASDQADQKLDDAKQAADEAKKAHNEAVADQTEADRKLAEAQQDVIDHPDLNADIESAKQNVNDAQDAYDQADAERNSAEAELDAAKDSQTQQKETADQAQDHYDQIKTDYSQAEEALREAVGNTAEKQSLFDGFAPGSQEYQNRLNELSQARADLDLAQQASESAKQNVNDAQDALTQATQDAELASQKLAEANQKLADKETEIAQAKEALADTSNDHDAMIAAQKDLINAKKQYDQAAQDQKQAETANAQAQNAVNAARAELEAAQQNLSFAISDEADSAQGFYKSMGTLDGDYAAALIQHHIDSWKVGSGDTAGVPEGITDFSNWRDSTKLDNVLTALKYIEQGNALRVAEGKEPLRVSAIMMAQAEAASNMENQIRNHWNGWYDKVDGIIAYTMGENLAAGWAADPDRFAVGEGVNPYTGWYSIEKYYYDFIVQYTNEHPNATEEEIVQAAKDAGAYSYNSGGSVGHYLNLVDEGYTVTGYGLTITNRSAYATSTQQFASDIYLRDANGKYIAAPSYTVEEYRQMILDYQASLNTIKAEAQNRVDAAQAALNAAIADAERTAAELADKSNALNAAKQAVENCEAVADSLSAAVKVPNETGFEENYTAVMNRLASAISATEASMAAQQNALNLMNTDAEQAEITAAQSAAATARAEAERAQQALTAAQEALAHLQSQVDQAQERVNTAQSRFDGMTAERDQALEDLNAAKQAEINARNTVNTLAGRLQTSADELERAKTALQDAVNQTSLCQNAYDLCDSNWQQTRQALTDAQTALDHLRNIENVFETAKANAQAAADTLARTTGAVAQTQQALAEAQNEADQASAALQGVEILKTAAQEAYDSAVTSASSTRTAADLAADRYQQMLRDISDMRDTLNTLLATKDTAAQKLLDLNAELQAVAARMIQLENEISSGNLKVADLTVRNAAVANDLSDATKEYKSVLAQYHDAVKQFQNAKDAVPSVTDLVGMQKRVEQLKNRVDTLKTDFDTAVAKHDANVRVFDRATETLRKAAAVLDDAKASEVLETTVQKAVVDTSATGMSAGFIDPSVLISAGVAIYAIRRRRRSEK